MRELASAIAARAEFQARAVVYSKREWETDEMPASRKDKRKGRKRTALIICKDNKEFWTTQKQFWQWAREGVIEKTGEQPLRGQFRREHDELMVLVSNTVLNLAHPNHQKKSPTNTAIVLRMILS